MKRSHMGLFYKAITIVSFLSIALIGHDLQAVTLGTSSAKQIGFRVANSGATNGATQNQGIIDQPPVVIQGRSGNAQQQSQQQAPQNQNTARAPNGYAQAGAPSMAMEPVVEGFGDKVPLTVAIQQILPQGYGYTLGDGVDAGQLVSWRGGRSWSAVLQDMLGQAGLAYSVNGRSVAINGNGASPTIVTGTPSMRVQPQPVIQPVQSAPVVVQQPVMMDPVPVMQPQPQMVMQQPQMQPMMQVQPQMQPVMMQPQPQMVMQQPQMQPMVQSQPMMMQPQGQQQVVMMQQQPQMMMVDPLGQPMMMQQMAPAQQVVPASTAPQPLQIENPLVFQSQTWTAAPGQTLRTLLQNWCARVGVELNWTAEFDYPIMATMNMTGTFEEAVRVLLIGFDGAKPTPRGRLHYNPAAGQSILIVEADGNHYGD